MVMMYTCMCCKCFPLKSRGQFKYDQHELKQNKLVVEFKLKYFLFFHLWNQVFDCTSVNVCHV